MSLWRCTEETQWSTAPAAKKTPPTSASRWRSLVPVKTLTGVRQKTPSVTHQSPLTAHPGVQGPKQVLHYIYLFTLNKEEKSYFKISVILLLFFKVFSGRMIIWIVLLLAVVFVFVNVGRWVCGKLNEDSGKPTLETPGKYNYIFFPLNMFFKCVNYLIYIVSSISRLFGNELVPWRLTGIKHRI